MLFRFCHGASDGFSYQVSVVFMKEVPILVYILFIWFSSKVLLSKLGAFRFKGFPVCRSVVVYFVWWFVFSENGFMITHASHCVYGGDKEWV